MNREFKPTSTLLRALFATASLLVSVMVVGSMTSLAEHYNADEIEALRAENVVTRGSASNEPMTESASA